MNWLYLAADKLNPDELGIPKTSADSAIGGILSTVYWIAGVIAVIVIIVAGIMYSLSSGDSGTVKKAKDAIIYAVVGLVVVMMAFAITQFVIGRL